MLLGLLGGFAYKLGATHWYSDYPLVLPDGRVIRLPDTFTSIDHPFHIAKERATVDALRAGYLPAWFSNQQGLRAVPQSPRVLPRAGPLAPPDPLYAPARPVRGMASRPPA